MRGKLLTIMGPTASGKTGLAVDLVQRFPLEIVSVDSALVYRGMDLGTAKPDAATLAQAPHRLIDIVDPTEQYSAADFSRDACIAIDEIYAKGKTPLLVGGSMLYFRALLEGLSALPAADADVRRQITERADLLGWPALHRELASIDRDAAARIEPEDRQRIQRALEVWQITGQTMSSLQSKQAKQGLAADVLKLVVCPAERQLLHQRIEQRFEGMLKEGFLDEMKSLFQRSDLSVESPSMRCVGYRQGWHYLAGEYSRSEFTANTVAATRQLAKRQLTWLRHEPATLWYDFIESKVKCPIFNKVEQFLELQA